MSLRIVTAGRIVGKGWRETHRPSDKPTTPKARPPFPPSVEPESAHGAGAELPEAKKRYQVPPLLLEEVRRRPTDSPYARGAGT